jgi:hypothetical protein
MILHVLNGDATRIPLEQSGVPGEFLVRTDVLHDGPAPAGLPPDEWRRVRARHLSDDDTPDPEFLEIWRDADRTLDRYAEYDEVVFWFEYDLFDQLLLIRYLDWMSRLPDDPRFRLICIGEFPGHPRFAGLGELNPRELASLFPSRRPITRDEVALGSRLWKAFGANDPRSFAAMVLESDTSALPFATGALRRHLEDFPSTTDGLARTERQILASIAAGARSGILQRLTRGRAPLLTLDGSFQRAAAPVGTFTLTNAARQVMHGGADYVALNGIDRWMGGVHLTDGRYRWNGTTIVSTA